MLCSMRHAIVAAKADGHVSEDAFEAAGAPDSGDRPRLSAASEFGWEQALWLATRGGAEAVGLEHVGYFGVGMQFDALRVDCAGGSGSGSGALCVFPWDTLRDRVQKFVHLGDDRHIVGTFVSGRMVRRIGGGGRARGT